VLFKDNFKFKPFILETNMRAIADPIYSDFLSKCRIGEYDFEYIQSRICGVALSDECENIFDSVFYRYLFSKPTFPKLKRLADS
jgi:hypothetical protein